MQAMTATLFRHLNEQGYKFSIITTGISSHIRYLLKKKGKPMGESTITNVMKVSIAGSSLKESEKKVYKS